MKLPETAANKVGSMKDTTVLKCHYLLSTSRPVTSSFLFQSRTSLAFFLFAFGFHYSERFRRMEHLLPSQAKHSECWRAGVP